MASSARSNKPRAGLISSIACGLISNSAFACARAEPRICTDERREHAMADDQPTCGKGLAANAILPEKLAALMSAMATMLENHTRALDPNEANGRLERDAYQRLVRDQRTLASDLEALARAMQSYRDLPMPSHDMVPLTD